MNSKTTYEKYLQIATDDNYVELMRFVFKTLIQTQDYKMRKMSYGLKVTNPRTKESFYAESDDGKFIIKYSIDDKNKIGSCIGEVVMRDYIESIKYTHDLLKM